jgi:hypothetical protein
MLATESHGVDVDSAVVPYVELSFGVIGKTLPADHGYGLYSAIALLPPCGILGASLIPLGVEHYARIEALFQALNLRCRKALVIQTLLQTIKARWCRKAQSMYARIEYYSRQSCDLVTS